MRDALAGRRLLIVGGGQQDYGQDDPPVGIGRAIALGAARAGASLAVSDLDMAAAEATCSYVADAAPGIETCVALAGDASDEDVARAHAEAAAERLGGLDGLVLNVGVSGGLGMAGTSEADWDRVMAVNVRSHFLGLKHALVLLEPGAAIVLVSSTGALLPSTHESPAYTASKAALAGLATFAAREAAGRGVRVNVLMPGLIDTPLGRLASLVKPDRDRIPIPLGRQGSSHEVAAAAVFLLSEAASYVTGQTLAVDGGLSGVL